MIAVFVNCAAIFLGSMIGVLFSKKIPQKVTDSIQLACGLVSFIMGVQMSFKYQNVVYLALALIFGGIVGTLLDIDGKILKFGKFLEKLFMKGEVSPSLQPASQSSATPSAGDTPATPPLMSHGFEPPNGVSLNKFESETALAVSNTCDNITTRDTFSAGKPQKNFAYAFLNASVLFCVGAMAIVGSFKAGIEHDYSMIFLKSILDGFISIGFSIAMGIGTAFSAISIFLYQGALTLLAILVQPYVSEQMISELTGSGGALIVFVGINLMGLKKIKTANYLPAVLFTVIFVLAEPIVKGIFLHF